MKKIVLILLKYGASLAIVAYLIYDAQRDETFTRFMDQPKDWRLFAGAGALCMVATCLTFVRWYFLVRALDLPFRLADAFRLGFLGYLLNFVSLGSVGGDLFKAVFIAREQKKKRAEAVATVVIDRVIGLYVLFVVATVAVVWTGIWSSPEESVRFIAKFTVGCAVAGALMIIAMIVPGVTHGRFSNYLRSLPRVGHVVGRLIDAIRLYASRPGVLFLTCAMSAMVHVLNTLGVFLISRAMLPEAPDLGAQFVIVSLGMVAGAAPLPMSGLGAFEGALDFLYYVVPGGVKLHRGDGLLVAFGYRAVTIVIALIGLGYWLFNRRAVAEAMHEMEELDQEAEPNGATRPTLSHMSPNGAPKSAALKADRETIR
ncbi:MAG TPA: lysylphosphatidylglycerol synthase transmembrane domain-containing protein [Pirellulales bacterium]